MTSPSDPSIPTLKPKDFQVCLGRCNFSAPFCIGSQSFQVFCNHFRPSLLAKQQNASSGTSVFASFLKLDAPSIAYLLFNAILFYSILPFTVRGRPCDRVVLSQFITGPTQGDKQQSTLKLTPRDNLALQISLRCVSLHCLRNTSKKRLGSYMNL